MLVNWVVGYRWLDKEDKNVQQPRIEHTTSASYFSSFPARSPSFDRESRERNERKSPYHEENKKATPCRAACTHRVMASSDRASGLRLPIYLHACPTSRISIYIYYIGSIWRGNGQFVWRMYPASSTTLFFHRRLCALPPSNTANNHHEEQISGWTDWKNCLDSRRISFVLKESSWYVCMNEEPPDDRLFSGEDFRRTGRFRLN